MTVTISTGEYAKNWIKISCITPNVVVRMLQQMAAMPRMTLLTSGIRSGITNKISLMPIASGFSVIEINMKACLRCGASCA